MAVQVGAGPVVTHRGARIGVPAGDLDVAEVDASVEHGGHESVAEHVRVHLRPQADGASQAPQAPGSRMAVHPGAAAVEQNRPAFPGSGGPVDGPADCWWQRDLDHLGALAAHAQHPVAVLVARSAMFAVVASKIRRPSRPSMATRAKS